MSSPVKSAKKGPRKSGGPKPHIPVKPQASCVKRTLLGVLLVVTLALGALYVILDPIIDRFFIFDHKQIHALASQAVKNHPNDTRAVIDEIVSTLKETHGPAIADTEEWVFNNAGGAMGAMTIIHASITEYLIIFGTPLGTEGHTGRHTADDYFNILEGEQWAFEAGALDKEVYNPGDVHHLVRGVVKQYKMHTGCWALELAQGWIPPMLPFGMADLFFSTLDFGSFYDTVRITGREMIKNLLRGKF